MVLILNSQLSADEQSTPHVDSVAAELDLIVNCSRWGTAHHKHSEIHIDVSHSRQPLVKGERLVAAAGLNQLPGCTPAAARAAIPQTFSLRDGGRGGGGRAETAAWVTHSPLPRPSIPQTFS